MPSKNNSISTGQKMPPKLRLKLANECENLVTKAKLVPSIEGFRFHLIHSKHLNESNLNKLKILFETLMRDMYEKSSWGWNEEEKVAEWKHSRTRIVVVTRNERSDLSSILTFEELPKDDEEIIGFMCFRYERGASKDECALYVYELHVNALYQRQGLGQELMRMAKVLAKEFKMDKIMLTSFRSNLQALKFYSKFNYSTDVSSPAISEADYTILSTKIKT